MTTATRLRFEQGARSDVGCVRRVNEDSWAARLRDGLWLVADGMGGHAHGQWASSTIAAALEAATLPETFEEAAAAARAALLAVNARIYAATGAGGPKIGSTVALRTDRESFVVLAGGRRTPPDGAVTVEGDADLGARILATMATTP